MPWHLLIENVTVLQADGLWQAGQSVAIEAEKIAWMGAFDAVDEHEKKRAKKRIDGQGHYLTPGLIDCHTHCVYAGNRADEFNLRLQGMSYAQIAKQGGGIQSTVRKTRQASELELFNQSLPRVKAMLHQGVTTVEIKSGYGLNLAGEEKMLRVARELGQALGIRVKTTFLGAHAIPLEYKNRPDDYIEEICERMLPQLHGLGLVDAVDVFCESIAFNLKQTERVFTTAQQLGIPVKCHAEQLTHCGGAALAARYHALSCEHLEYLDDSGAEAMAEQGVVAVLLPGAYYFLRETRKPPIDLFRKYGVKMALATDCNPGSSPTTSLLLMLNMGCTLFEMTVQEALTAVTVNAAKALGLSHELGRIEPGYRADLVLWDLNDGSDLCGQFGFDPVKRVFIGGVMQ